MLLGIIYPSSANAIDGTEISDTTMVADDMPLLAAKDSTRNIRKSRAIRTRTDLTATVDFSAKDSLLMTGDNTALMFGSSKIVYDNISIDAQQITMDMNDNTVYAVGVPDSLGDLQGNPVFKDPSGEYNSKTMDYNFKTQKGYITNVVTEQGEGYLTGGTTKKTEGSEYYIKDGRYTTCDNHDCPHFYFQLTKAKVIPNKNIVTGPAYMVLADVPLPLAIPFGFFPFSEKYSSGIIFPSYGDDYTKGYYLRDGGYYFAISDYMDLALTGELYSLGSWGLSAQSSYKKRYKFSGNFSLSYLTTITGDKGYADYAEQTNFKIAWTHTQDAKANPNMSLSASVNFTTSGYNRNDLNTQYTDDYTDNTKSSSVNMSYKIPNSLWSLSLSANVTQRTSDSTLTVSFPNLTLSMSQTAPFKRKNAVGSEKWYEKIKMSYSGYLQNSLTANESEFFHKSIVKDWSNGMRHTVPISATFNVLKYINITPSISMTDRMYTSKIERDWDATAGEVVMDTVYGFYNVFDFSTAISFDTKLYGFYKPMKFLGDKVQMIRHVLTPTVSFSYSPDFSNPGWGYYDTYLQQTDNGNGVISYESVKYSYFSHGLYGTASSGESGTVSFSLANNLEMKVKSDADSTGVKKISLIENLSLSQSYNMAADSMNWSNISSSITLRLINNFNLSLSATWDVYTYELNSSGSPVRVNKLRWNEGKGFGRLQSTGTSFSYTFNNQTFKKLFGKKDEKDSKSEPASTQTPDELAQQSDATKKEEKSSTDRSGYDLTSEGYVKWTFPWSLTMNYSVTYGYGDFNTTKMEYDGSLYQNLSISGSVSPTPGWNMSVSSSYNFDTGKISYMSCNISRDLHCFSMSASFVPFGSYKSYTFNIAVKSAMLKDLKYDKKSSYGNTIDWY